MVEVPDFGFESMSHEQIVGLLHGAPGAAANGSVAPRLDRIANTLQECIGRIERARTDGALNWTGPAARAADELIRRMTEYSSLATDHAMFFSGQSEGQAEGASRVQTSMPEPVPNPLAVPQDLGNPSLVGMTQSWQQQELASQTATVHAREIMTQWADDTVSRVDQMSTMEPLPPVPMPDPNPGTTGPSATDGFRAPGETLGTSSAATPASGGSAPAPVVPAPGSPTHQQALRPSVPQSTTPSSAPPLAPPASHQGPGRSVAGPSAGDLRPGGPPRTLAEPEPGGGRGATGRPGTSEPLRGSTGSPNRAGPGAPARGTRGGPPAAEPEGRAGSPLAQRDSPLAQRDSPPAQRGSQSGRSGAPAGGGRRKSGEEDKEHRRRYGLDSDEYFDMAADEDGVLRDPNEDGRYVAPPVIGER